MKPRTLRRLTDDVAAPVRPASPGWYYSQREHRIGLIDQAEISGAYSRQQFNCDAQFACRHFRCSLALLGLGQADGIIRWSRLERHPRRRP